MVYLTNFRNWFMVFMSQMFNGVWTMISNIFVGIGQIFDFKTYIFQLSQYDFGWTWILVIFSILLALGIWGGVIALIVLGIRKYIRFRKTLVGNEDLLEEIAELHRDVIRLTTEKEKIMAMKVNQAGMSYEELKAIFDESTPKPEGFEDEEEGANGEVLPPRFTRLALVDKKYENYVSPVYDESMTLSQLCDDLRNYACYNARLYYEIKTIRLMVAGLAATKLIVLQGISGTGKTSLPYIMGKYFMNDATIASVQPSWRDRSELFGYFNEFSKKFNETEVLRRIYESGYNDDVNVIVLDEMNIARVEYYFAEMLSVLEMPDQSEWKIELVPSPWKNDPVKLDGGNLHIPPNVWYVGTANNDDSTFAVSDKVYDRALVINLDSKGVPFEPKKTASKRISYSYVEELYRKAVEKHPVSAETLDKIEKLDLYVIDRFRVAFGNRIMKQLNVFVPVYVACGGTENEAIDYILATKVFRKFESLNLSLIRDEIRGLIAYLDKLFGKDEMQECIAFLKRLQKTY